MERNAASQQLPKCATAKTGGRSHLLPACFCGACLPRFVVFTLIETLIETLSAPPQDTALPAGAAGPDAGNTPAAEAAAAV